MRWPPASRRSPSSSPSSGVAPVVPIGRRDEELAGILFEFLARYANPQTRQQNPSHLRDLFRVTGRRHPSELTEADLFTWVTGGGRALANNTVRQRLSCVRTFLTWCSRSGLAADLDPHLAPRRRQYPKTYGKVQAKHPGRRRLTFRRGTRKQPGPPDGDLIDGG